MLTTTPDIIRANIVANVEGIDPLYPGYQEDDYRWDYAPAGGVGGRIRRFRIDESLGTAQRDDPLHSRGEQYTYALHIIAGYEGLPPEDTQIAQQDGVDLRKALDPLVGTLEGLLRIRLDEIDASEFGEDNRLITATFAFTVDYLHDTGLGN